MSTLRQREPYRAVTPRPRRPEWTPTPRQAQILARVRATPAGFVRTYGDVSPGAPRAAGAALRACQDPALPWHRIVRADGSLAKGMRQRVLLEREGVPFRGGRVDMRTARLPDFGEVGRLPNPDGQSLRTELRRPGRRADLGDPTR